MCWAKGSTEVKSIQLPWEARGIIILIFPVKTVNPREVEKSLSARLAPEPVPLPDHHTIILSPWHVSIFSFEPDIKTSLVGIILDPLYMVMLTKGFKKKEKPC